MLTKHNNVFINLINMRINIAKMMINACEDKKERKHHIKMYSNTLLLPPELGRICLN